MNRETVSAKQGSGSQPRHRGLLPRFLQHGVALVLGAALLAAPAHSQDWGAFEYIRLADQLKAGQVGTSQDPNNPGAPATASIDITLLQDALLLHRLSAQFYNLNATKAYLSTSVTSPGPGTGTGAAPGTGATPGTIGTPVGNGTGTGTGTVGTGTGANTGSGVVQPSQDTGTGVGTGTDTGTGTGTGTGDNTGTGIGATADDYSLSALRSIVEEIRTHHNAHVAMLEQRLGANAPAAPQFQNLDATTLQQFLTMAQMMEDVGVSANAAMVPEFENRELRRMMSAVGAVEGRHAGAIRAWRKAASTAIGGDPNLTITEDGQPVNPLRTREQVLALIQPFIVGPVAPGTTPGTTTPADGSTGGNTGTGTGTGTNNGTGTGTNNGTGTGTNNGTGTGTDGNAGTGTGTGGNTGTGTGTNNGTGTGTGAGPNNGTGGNTGTGTNNGTGGNTGTGTNSGTGTGGNTGTGGTNGSGAL